MAYMIRYGSDKQYRMKIPKPRRLLPIILTILVLMAGLGIRHYLLLQDPVASQALDTLTHSLKEGEGLGSALTTFCREILADAV